MIAIRQPESVERRGYRTLNKVEAARVKGLGQARVESDSKDKSLAVTRCNGVPITLGVVA